MSARLWAFVPLAWLVAAGCGKSGGGRAGSDASAGGATGEGGADLGQGGTGGASSGTGGDAEAGATGSDAAADRADAQADVEPDGSTDWSVAACRRCTAYAPPVKVATGGVAALDSLSGLAVSRAQPDIIFMHNDRDRPVVYALDLQGRALAQITLTGAGATDSDFEDIAIGPCGAANCVFLGDIGDNNARRTEYAVYRFLLPTVPTTPGNTTMTPAYDRFAFVYEDGSHNAEGLMVSPDGTIYVVTKVAPGTGGRVPATGPSSVYRLPPSMTTATKVATLSVPTGTDLAASAAAAHPCGLGFILRTYDKVYEFTVPPGEGFEASFTTTPQVVAMPDEPQSEGIDYRADGLGFITSGEGVGAPIVETLCAP